MQIFARTYLILTLFTSSFLFSPLYASCDDREEPVIKTIQTAHFKTIDSTQKQAEFIISELNKGIVTPYKETFSLEGVPERSRMLVISAESQTQGMGSFRRVWHSPLGGVYMTALVPFPSSLKALAFHIPQVSNLAVCQTLEHFGVNGVRFKWVNEAVVGDKKCAGVLCALHPNVPTQMSEEQMLTKDHMALIGIGINVTMNESLATQKYEETTDTFKIPFTSIHMETGQLFQPSDVLTVLQEKLASNLNLLFRAQNFERDFLPSIKHRLAYVGEVVEYSDDYHEIERILFLSLNEKGEMIASDISGEKRAYNFGRIRPIQRK
jgi:BirA family biotin operon repressor/biotin-[acetyl-CoA-carboxylase] ligase